MLGPGRRQALRVRRHRGQGRVPARRRRARRPARRARRPAPTAGRWRATTTTSPRPPVVAVRDGAAACRRAPRDRGRPAAPRRRESERRGEHRVRQPSRPRWSSGEPSDGEVGARSASPCSAAASVGTEVARAALEQADDLAARVGAPLELVGDRRAAAATRHATSTSTRDLFTTDAEALVRRDDVDIVVEVIGGIEPARVADPAPRSSTARRVVTANKALLAEDGADAVRRRREGRRATSTSRPRSPGRSRSCGRCASRSPATGSAACSASSTAPPTTSSTRWTPTGAGFAEALEEAQALGYAEADPTADVEGFDAAAKAAILAGLAFHTRVTARRRPPRGHHRGHRGRRRLGRARWAAWSSCSRSAKLTHGRRRGRVGAACTRR